ncbi:MAG TPA: GNAT family N-acetyltransferase [Pirellulales bacterium]|nr:GNAT family N-acetyltransferase [Pirellulales bacterium]
MTLLAETLPPAAAPPALRVELFTGPHLPAGLLERCARLVGHGPFGNAAWWSAWWEHFRPAGSELFLLAVSRGTEWVGLAPWYAQTKFGLGRVLRFLGDGRACTDYPSLIALPELRPWVFQAVGDWLAAEAGRSWDAGIFAGIASSDSEWQQLADRLAQEPILVDQAAIANTWRLALPESWEAYVERFSKSHRNRLRRAQRELFDSGRAVVRRVQNPADFAQSFALQRHLHQLRRNSIGDAGCYADPRFESFLRAANEQLLEQRMLRLMWTELDGEPVAFDSGYAFQDTLYMYQTGFDPSKAEFSPGRLHFQASIMKAIEEGYRVFDFLRGDEPYKAHFRANSAPVLETRLIGPRLRARLGHGYWKLQKRLKAQARRWREQRGSSSQQPDRSEPPEA